MLRAPPTPVAQIILTGIAPTGAYSLDPEIWQAEKTVFSSVMRVTP